MGHAAFYGLAVMSDSWIMYALALFSQCATFAFIHYVERCVWAVATRIHAPIPEDVRGRN